MDNWVPSWSILFWRGVLGDWNTKIIGLLSLGWFTKSVDTIPWQIDLIVREISTRFLNAQYTEKHWTQQIRILELQAWFEFQRCYVRLRYQMAPIISFLPFRKKRSLCMRMRTTQSTSNELVNTPIGEKRRVLGAPVRPKIETNLLRLEQLVDVAELRVRRCGDHDTLWIISKIILNIPCFYQTVLHCIVATVQPLNLAHIGNPIPPRGKNMTWHSDTSFVSMKNEGRFAFLWQS